MGIAPLLLCYVSEQWGMYANRRRHLLFQVRIVSITNIMESLGVFFYNPGAPVIENAEQWFGEENILAPKFTPHE